jgi:hypothetical protein
MERVRMSLPSRFDEWLYPELRAFRSQEDRKRALARCSKPFSRANWLSWVVLVGGATVWAFFWEPYIALPLAVLLIRVGVPKPLGMGILLLVYLPGVVGLVVLVSWLGSFSTRSRLRGLLAEEQHQTCQQCGYDLTGNVTGVCPECGTAVPG